MTEFIIQVRELEDSLDLHTLSDEELDRLHGAGFFFPVLLGAAAGGTGYIAGKAAANASNGKNWNDGLSVQDFATSAAAGAFSPVNSLATFGLSTASSFISTNGISNLGKQVGGFLNIVGEGASAIRN